MRSKNQKLKLLYLAKIMKEQTDENHGITMPEVLAELAKYDIEAQRKSIYDDFAALDDFGIEIMKDQVGKKTYYYVGNRDFEIAELKFLVDAISASRFMTEKKTKELITKLENLVSINDAKLLKRQIFVAGRIKSMNETIYYSVDKIHHAINSNHQITFQYFNWNEKGEQELRHDGAYYKVSPWALFLNDENYYLVAIEETPDGGKIKHYRVDKMLHLDELEEKRIGSDIYDTADKAQYTNKCFGMFGGEESRVELLCENNMANVIIDRFGIDSVRIPVDDNHFKVCVDVQVSKQFLGWIIALGSGVKITSPESVCKQVKDMIKDAAEMYK